MKVPAKAEICYENCSFTCSGHSFQEGGGREGKNNHRNKAISHILYKPGAQKAFCQGGAKMRCKAQRAKNGGGGGKRAKARRAEAAGDWVHLTPDTQP